MKINRIPPNLSVFSPNQKDAYGVITIPLHLKIDYNFGVYSTMKFDVYQKIYDEYSEQWIDNPIYDKLVEDNLIYSPNENNVFSYCTNKLLSDNSYGIDTDANQTNKQSNVKSGVDVLEYVPKMKGCTLCDETLLFDVGANSGYGWSYRKYIYGNPSDPRASGYVVNANSMQNIVQEVFFPVKVGDIIAMGSEVDKTNESDLYCSVASGLGEGRYRYCVYFYDNNYTNRCRHMGDTASGNTINSKSYSPIKRYLVKDGDLGVSYHRPNGGNHYYEYVKEGYIRFDGFAKLGVSSPAAGYVRIFDGERRCKKIDVDEKEIVQHNIPWWVIVNIEETNDNRNKKKTVTAYSYEYTLSKRSVTIEDDTLPLYVPDPIVDVVNSGDFVIDKWDGTVSKGAQRMKRGLLNQVLDNLSGWKVKYISDGIMERYRQIESVDNANIYTFLMNTVQTKYQCHIIFDCEHKYINIVKHEDIVGMPNTNVVLDWRNCLKQNSIKSDDNKYVTALRVHSEDDTYGLGFVNPNGTNVIYNFNAVIDELDYSVDNTHINPNTNAPYTIKELINKYYSDIADIQTSYRNYTKSLIGLIQNSLKLQIGFGEAFSQYTKVVTENNVLVKIQGNNTPVAEVPPANEDFNSNGLWSYIDNRTNNPRTCWASYDKFEEIKSTTADYWKAYITYENCKTQIAMTKYNLREIANKFTFNINVAKKLYDNATFDNNNNLEISSYPCLFTPVELIELFKYIREADWTEQNVTFNEEYSSDDIYNTLVDLFDTAKYELDHIYYKPNYDFESEIADIFRVPEMAVVCEDLYLGNSLYLSDDEYLEPILLTFNIDYDSFNSSKLTMTTDYKRKPIDFRVYELLATVNQQSVTSPTYTFDN